MLRLEMRRILLNGGKLLSDSISIQEKVNANPPILRLVHSQNYEIDIMFDNSEDLLDVIFIENNKWNAYDAFNETTKNEIKEFIDSI